MRCFTSSATSNFPCSSLLNLTVNIGNLTDPDMAPLQHQAPKLPTELLLNIFDFLAYQPRPTVHIDPSYRPPPHLQVCAWLRKECAAHYYRDTTFMFRSNDLLAKWIASLPGEHHDLLTRVDLDRASRWLPYAQADLLQAQRSILAVAGVLPWRSREYLWVCLRTPTYRGEIVEIWLPGKESLATWTIMAQVCEALHPPINIWN